MKGDFHVRFRENVGVKFPCVTRLGKINTGLRFILPVSVNLMAVMNYLKSCIIFFLILHCGCSSFNSKVLDAEAFTINTPRSWKYIKRRGIDSFVGEIKGPNVRLTFDQSSSGYARPWIKNPEEYILSYISANYSRVFNDPNVSYTDSSLVQHVIELELYKVSIGVSHFKDTAAVRVEPYIEPDIKIENLPWDNEADYQVNLSYKDSTVTFPVAYPEEFKRYNFKFDTVDNFIIKTYWPKEPGTGVTGIYFRKINNGFDLGITGENLSKKKQEKVLKAFSTIKIK